MLLACKACHRVYDVANLAVGKKVRCGCGTLNEVAKPVPVERAMAHCGSCGGALAAGATSCAYCNARITLLEERLGGPCPHCATRLPEGSRFCPGCGKSVEPRGAVQALADGDCPVCKAALQVVEGRQDPFHQCTTCAGLWLSKSAFERFVAEQSVAPTTPEEKSDVSRHVRLGRRLKTEPLGPRCPVCREAMLRHEFARHSGVLVDQCRTHGWWFDAHELEAIARFVRAGGLTEAEKRDRASRRSRRAARSWRRRVAAERHNDHLELFEFLFDLADDD